MISKGTTARRGRWVVAAATLLVAGGAAWLAGGGARRTSIDGTDGPVAENAGPVAPRTADGRMLEAAPARGATVEAAPGAAALAPRTADPSSARSLPLRVDIVDRASGQTIAGALWTIPSVTAAEAPASARRDVSRTPSGDESRVDVVTAADTTLPVEVAAPPGWLVAPVTLTFAVSARTERLRAVVPVAREARVRVTLVDPDGRPLERPAALAFTVDGVPATTTLEPDDGAGCFRVRGIAWVSRATVVATVVEPLRARFTAFRGVRSAAGDAPGAVAELPGADLPPAPPHATGVLPADADAQLDLRLEGVPAAADPEEAWLRVEVNPGARAVFGEAEVVGNAPVQTLRLVWGRLRSARDRRSTTVRDRAAAASDAGAPAPTTGAVEVDLRDEGGGPAVGVPVELAGVVAWTDAKGRARFDDVESGAFDLRPADPLVRFPTRSVRVVAPEATRVDVVAQAPATLDVEVVDDAGAPWPSADVFVVAEAGSRVADVAPSGEQRLDASADLAGRRTVHGVPPGEVVVEGRAAGRSTTARVAVAPGERAAVRVVVPRVDSGR